MNGEELPIGLILLASATAIYFGYEVDRRRKRLHSIFDTFDHEESQVAQALESLVESGQLQPYRLQAQT